MSINSAHILLKELIEKTPNRKKSGYTQIFYEGEWQWMHRVIAKEKMGADIHDGFEVHHIDGDKQNNDPNNLKVLSKEQHQALHKQLDKSKDAQNQNVRRYIADRIKSIQSKGQNSGKTIASTVSEETTEKEKIRLKARAALRFYGYNFNQGDFERDSYGGTCGRCGGSGHLQEYSHVEGGVCFACGGSGRR